MTQEIIDIVKSNERCKYRVTFSNGKKSVAVLDYFEYYNTIVMKRGHKFYIINNIESAVPIKSKTPIEWFRHNNNRLIKCLTESGLWADILAWAKSMENLTDDEITSYDVSNPSRGFIGIDAFNAMFTNKSIKAVNYDKYYDYETMVRKAITDKLNYNTPTWYKGYDNSIGIKYDEKDGISLLRGWYSEEYKNCGNGHYYLLIDAKHAIFCEND